MDPPLDGYRRYAIYWAPECDSPLARFGAAWLGWDPERGEAAAPAKVVGLPHPREQLVARPARYGFHATLKNPFRLAAPDAGELDRALADFACRVGPVIVPPLSLDAELGFLALRPSRPSPQLDALAAACVREFHHLAAPPSAEELARRTAKGLSPAEEANLDRWGYPYVMKQFRFHLTLTGPLEPEMALAALAALSPAVAPLTREPVALRSLALFGDPGDGGRFRLLRRHALTG